MVGSGSRMKLPNTEIVMMAATIGAAPRKTHSTDCRSNGVSFRDGR